MELTSIPESLLFLDLEGEGEADGTIFNLVIGFFSVCFLRDGNLNFDMGSADPDCIIKYVAVINRGMRVSGLFRALTIPDTDRVRILPGLLATALATLVFLQEAGIPAEGLAKPLSITTAAICGSIISTSLDK